MTTLNAGLPVTETITKPVKTYYRTIWISDTHLGSRACQIDYLLAFLKSVRCDNLFIVGDFIDIWQLKRRWHWPQEVNNIIRRILGMAKRGTKVTYIPGNHDDLLRDFLGVQFGGVELKGNAIHTTADGRRFLIQHGDELDVVIRCRRWLALLGDWAYDGLIRVNGIVNFVRRRFSLPYWSLADAIKRRVKNAVAFVGRFEEGIAHEARKAGVDGVICGHIHQPAIKPLEGLTYCNTGDWVESCTALVEREDGSLELLRWADVWAHHAALSPAKAGDIADEHAGEDPDFKPHEYMGPRPVGEAASAAPIPAASAEPKPAATFSPSPVASAEPKLKETAPPSKPAFSAPAAHEPEREPYAAATAPQASPECAPNRDGDAVGAAQGGAIFTSHEVAPAVAASPA